MKQKDIVAMFNQLAVALGDQVVACTKHIDAMFPPTAISRWMDLHRGHFGGWNHRVLHGHDFSANAHLIYKKFGIKGVMQYPFELGRDFMTPDGLPLPGVQKLVEKGLVSAKTATQWLSVNVGDALIGGIALHSTYKLYKKTRNGRLSRKDAIIAGIGSVVKIVAGVKTIRPVVFLAGVADAVMILDNLFDLKSRLSDVLEIDVGKLLRKGAVAAGSGMIAGSVAAGGAFAGTAMLASASTGTAIATLSGAAATNATLAALGGGALSAGGLGIAGGVVILSGGAALVAVGVGFAAWRYFGSRR